MASKTQSCHQFTSEFGLYCRRQTDYLCLQDLVQLNMNRIQQLTALEAGQALEGRIQPTEEAQDQACPELLVPPPVGQIFPAQEPKGSWVPVAFADSLGSGMITMQHAGQPWILFRDASGNAACIEDCCAHRACPLSLVLSIAKNHSRAEGIGACKNLFHDSNTCTAWVHPLGDHEGKQVLLEEMISYVSV